ncbi:hypothetical protein KP509_22G053200 [Ceratopteris richardii]|uniref:Uncharacterized protein n=1 Tax=Ceratopteris richardii TaxID=49495 RepID=A0A8T2S683_CERRI|nr:hypothetical protein KP509_22G053200 [Ceratopteris richardii]
MSVASASGDTPSDLPLFFHVLISCPPMVSFFCESLHLFFQSFDFIHDLFFGLKAGGMGKTGAEGGNRGNTKGGERGQGEGGGNGGGRASGKRVAGAWRAGGASRVSQGRESGFRGGAARVSQGRVAGGALLGFRRGSREDNPGGGGTPMFHHVVVGCPYA